MNVLHILDTCNRGGAETLVLDILRNAHTADVNMYFASFKGGELLSEYQEAAFGTFLLGRNAPIDITSIKKLHELLVSKEIDVIHTHLTIDIFHAQLAKIGTKAKHVHTHHGYDYGASLKDLMVERLFSPFLNGHIFVSRPLHDYYFSKFHIHRNWNIVENGVDVKKIDKAKNKELSIRDELKLSPDIPLLGMVGNFVNTGRDQLTICKALKVLREYGDNFHFLFIGRSSSQEPEFYEKCVQYCNLNSLDDCVHFLGPRVDVPDILMELDLFAYASNHDTFGIAVIEAMLAGVPVIVNDLEIFGIIGQHGKYLSMYPTKDYGRAADMMHSFLHNVGNFSNIACRAKKYARETYSIDRNVAESLKIYREVIANGK